MWLLALGSWLLEAIGQCNLIFKFRNFLAVNPN